MSHLTPLSPIRGRRSGRGARNYIFGCAVPPKRRGSSNAYAFDAPTRKSEPVTAIDPLIVMPRIKRIGAYPMGSPRKSH